VRTMEPVSLLDTVRVPIILGQLSYYLYLLACLLAVVDIARIESPAWTDYAPWAAARAVAVLVWNIVVSPSATAARIAPELWAHPRPFAIVAIGLLVALFLSLRVDALLSQAFSAKWYSKQTELRKSLKAAREAMSGAPV